MKWGEFLAVFLQKHNWVSLFYLDSDFNLKCVRLSPYNPD